MDAKVTKSSGEEETVTNVGSASFSPSGELLLWINSSTPPLRFEPPWMLRPVTQEMTQPADPPTPEPLQPLPGVRRITSTTEGWLTECLLMRRRIST